MLPKPIEKLLFCTKFLCNTFTLLNREIKFKKTFEIASTAKLNSAEAYTFLCLFLTHYVIFCHSKEQIDSVFFRGGKHNGSCLLLVSIESLRNGSRACHEFRWKLKIIWRFYWGVNGRCVFKIIAKDYNSKAQKNYNKESLYLQDW